MSETASPIDAIAQSTVPAVVEFKTPAPIAETLANDQTSRYVDATEVLDLSPLAPAEFLGWGKGYRPGMQVHMADEKDGGWRLAEFDDTTGDAVLHRIVLSQKELPERRILPREDFLAWNPPPHLSYMRGQDGKIREWIMEQDRPETPLKPNSDNA